MANIVNLYAETGANMISDDTTPALTLFNSGASSNAGAEVRGLIGVSTASIDVVNTPAIQVAAAGGRVVVSKTITGNMSTATLRVIAGSIASGVVLDIGGSGGWASITSVVLTTVANTDYAIRVMVNDQPRWVPCFKDAAIIGAAAF